MINNPRNCPRSLAQFSPSTISWAKAFEILEFGAEGFSRATPSVQRAFISSIARSIYAPRSEKLCPVNGNSSASWLRQGSLGLALLETEDHEASRVDADN